VAIECGSESETLEYTVGTKLIKEKIYSSPGSGSVDDKSAGIEGENKAKRRIIHEKKLTYYRYRYRTVYKSTLEEMALLQDVQM
jgi:hypothetical protein